METYPLCFGDLQENASRNILLLLHELDNSIKEILRVSSHSPTERIKAVKSLIEKHLSTLPEKEQARILLGLVFSLSGAYAGIWDAKVAKSI